MEPTDYTVVQNDYRTLDLGPSGIDLLLKWGRESYRRRQKAQMDFLQKTSKTLKGRKVKVEKIPAGYAAEEIIKAAGRFRADLIVMGSHTRDENKRWYIGSAVEKVSYSAPCPVAVITARECLPEIEKLHPGIL